MKKLIIFLFSIFLCFNALAQLEVKPNSFKMIPGFVNQNTEIYDDDNNVLYAVIKVKTEKLDNKQRHQLLFDGNAATFIELEYKQDEIWVYLSSTPATYLKISHPDFGSTEFEFPFDLEPQKGYEMVLVNKTLSAYGTGSLTINTEPKGAKIQLNGYEVKQETPYSNDMIAAGRYEITVSKASYKTITQTIVIKDGDNITLNLEMMVDVAMITINADNETEVYIDNTFMKSGTWSGELYSGQHKVSLKNPCYRTLTKTITLIYHVF